MKSICFGKQFDALDSRVADSVVLIDDDADHCEKLRQHLSVAQLVAFVDAENDRTCGVESSAFDVFNAGGQIVNVILQVVEEFQQLLVRGLLSFDTCTFWFAWCARDFWFLLRPVQTCLRHDCRSFDAFVRLPSCSAVW